MQHTPDSDWCSFIGQKGFPVAISFLVDLKVKVNICFIALLLSSIFGERAMSPPFCCASKSRRIWSKACCINTEKYLTSIGRICKITSFKHKFTRTSPQLCWFRILQNQKKWFACSWKKLWNDPDFFVMSLRALRAPPSFFFRPITYHF